MKPNKLMFGTGILIVIVGFLFFIKSIGTMAVMSSFDFGNFLTQQPAIVTSMFFWLFVVIIGALTLYKGSEVSK